MGNGLRTVAMGVMVLALAGYGRSLAAETRNDADRRHVHERRTWPNEIYYPVVVEDLALTADQVERLAALDEELDAAAHEKHRREEAMSKEEKAAAVAALKAELRVVAAKEGVRFDELPSLEQEGYAIWYLSSRRVKEFDRRSEKILRPEQMRRISEIVCRLIGPQIFRKEYCARFELTIEQKLKFHELLEPYIKEHDKLTDEVHLEINANDMTTQGAVVAMRGHNRKVRAVQQRYLEKMVGMLTKRQKEIFDELRGKEFDLEKFDEQDAQAAFGE